MARFKSQRPDHGFKARPGVECQRARGQRLKPKAKAKRQQGSKTAKYEARLSKFKGSKV